MDDFAYLFYTAKNVTAAFDKYVAANYVQHNSNIADGRAAAIAALDPLFSSPTTSFDVSQASRGDGVQDTDV
jgi:predicted SnoaL-like aldol condensation-catalyzing enzyme